ncbi:DNA translocase FtsK [Sansalvadorimonas verongulae]|uniref:DNA translocase FtsK n=1 Tax=Sansalvadorimonas verongulae TaxID=2172824 RepID=UPI0012BCEAE9|nr:DNA translocase FtsK [Sansalvadorimonas verongulae]MTI12649.1 DNA translocase FtsK [Sansalvadorimonas verongulae]
MKAAGNNSAAGSSAVKSWLAVRLQEGLMLTFIVLGLYLAMAMISYSPDDPGWTRIGPVADVANYGGRAGAWFADVFLSLFGYLGFLFPFLLLFRAWTVFRDRHDPAPWNGVMLILRFIGLVLCLVCGDALLSLHLDGHTGMPSSEGGILGRQTVEVVLPVLSLHGTTLVLSALLLFGVTLLTDLSWFALMDGTGYYTLKLFSSLTKSMLWLRDYLRGLEEKRAVTKARKEREQTLLEERARQQRREPPQIAPPPKLPEVSAKVVKEKQQVLFEESAPSGEKPALGLLDVPDKNQKKGYSQESLEGMSRLLELKLKDFGVVAEVVAVHPGPVITRFEIQPAAGVKVSKISNLAKDLARSLAVISVRVVEVIPGKSVVGIEIPNEDREVVYFSELIASQVFDSSDSALALALGHDIAGQPVVANLAKMPHLLVAGTTGSGKSVGVNAMILSMLYKASPQEVRLIMVDPKMLELSVYDGIPHLLAPVITDMKEAANGLRWCVAEMERRYKLMAAMGVRNLAGFNRKVKDAAESGEPLRDPLYQPVSSEDIAPELGTLPFIVVVIDEFADMMMIVGKKVEELIARIAQKARAAGIHLILATQRPSVDVITGLIKANVPTRISFQVSSKIDSRTILDQGGAEQLLGHGDMLYLPPGTSLPVRVHGAFVSDEEVHRVVADWKRRGEPDYIEEVLNGVSEEGGGEFGEADSEQDPLYDEAVAFVTESRKASISSVQRKLKIGYNRSANIIEAMERAGVISPAGANGNREVIAPPAPR